MTLSTETRTALQDEADREHVSLERHINSILARRVARPSWPDRAEAQALAEEIEQLQERLQAALDDRDEALADRDRARGSAALHEADAHRARSMVREAVASGTVIASPNFKRAFFYDLRVCPINGVWDPAVFIREWFSRTVRRR
ncbi:hypothetical protein [Leucobacter muris]|uniref:hypothetical protein n=1 Tax=Leucobacter muris TaxID=1935379 RepID=UPI001E57F5CF|nr:hypothetical protein [Leucobacter muris]